MVWFDFLLGFPNGGVILIPDQHLFFVFFLSNGEQVLFSDGELSQISDLLHGESREVLLQTADVF